MSTKKFTGAKGGGSTFKQNPDNLRSTDTFEGVLGIGIGPMEGPVNGLKSIFLDGTALENETGEMNFGDFIATIGNGDPAAFPQAIQLKLGAGGSPTNISLPLTNTTGNGNWITKTLVNTNADFIDLRFIVNQLFRQDKNGIYANTANIEINMKPTGKTTWINPTLGTPSGGYSPTGINVPGLYGAILRTMVPEQFYDYGGDYWQPQSPNFAITGKTSSPSVYELRLAVPNTGEYANVSWDVRCRLVERESVDNDPNFEKRQITWESMAAVYSDVLGVDEEWRGLTWMQLYGKASDQLTGVPEVTGIWKTKIVSVPPGSVYNPATRSYTGNIWDGSWTKAFTNDPAWVINDAITDPLAGLSLIANGSFLNKWDALDLSKWASEKVPDGAGGLHNRYSLNLAISEPQKAEEFIRYLAGAVGALAWDQGDGQWRLRLDKPDVPVDLFTLDNIDGEIVYANTDVDTRFNDITGSFKNEEMAYRQDRVRLFDNPSIAKLGRKTTTIALVGCTNRQEALRRVKLRLRSTVNETRVANFVTNRRGRNVEPLDLILIADGDLGEIQKPTTGRGSLVNTTTIGFRDPIFLPSGVTYQIVYSVPNPDYNPDPSSQPTSANWTKPTITRKATISPASTNYNASVYTLQVTADTAFPADLPYDTSFAIEAPGLPTLPKLFRVTSVGVQDDGERISISAIEVDTGKWAASDNVQNSDTVFQDLRGAPPVPLPPINGNLLSLVKVPVDQGYQVNLVANWIRPSGAYVNGFRVRYAINGGAWQVGAERTDFTTFELVNPTPGDYQFEVTTIDRRGSVSDPLSAFFAVTQDAINAAEIFYVDPNTGLPTPISVNALKPAEAGADPTGSHQAADTAAVSGRPANQVIIDIDGVKTAINTQTLRIDQILSGGGGDGGAAQSAQTALQAAQNAETARSLAVAAKNAAEQAKSDALVAAQNSYMYSQNAQGFAGTASGKADIATQKASDAEQFASNAQAQVQLAATQAGLAQGYKNDAQTAKSDAQGFAGAASQASGVSVSNAVQALATVTATLPFDFLQGGDYYTPSYNADPVVAVPPFGTLSASPQTYSYPIVDGVGKVLQINTSANQTYVAQVGVTTVLPGRRYRVTSRFRVVSGQPSAVIVYNYGLPSTFGTNTGQKNTQTASPTPGQWYVVTTEAESSEMGPTGVYHRAILGVIITNGQPAVVQVQYLKSEDVTAAVGAPGSAAAAAESARLAGISETNAGTAASAANTSRADASAFAGNAQTYRDQAATSASDALGYKNTASQQALLSSSAAQGAYATAANLMPGDFSEGARYWGNGVNAVIGSTIPYNGVSFTFPYVTGVGYVAQTTGTAGNTEWLVNAGTVPIQPGRTYRYTVEARLVNNTGAAPVRVGASFLGYPAGSPTYNYSNGGAFLDLTGGWQTTTWTNVAADYSPSQSVRIRTGLYVNFNGSTATVQIRSFKFEDITDILKVDGLATAAFNSAQLAGTKADAAGVSATAADTARIAAQAANGTAQGFSEAARGFAADANGYVSTASSYATLAAQFGSGSLGKNPYFTGANWIGSVPPEWGLWAIHSGAEIRKADQPGRYGPNALFMSRVNGGNTGIFQDIAPLPGGAYVIETEVLKLSGNWQGAGLLFEVSGAGLRTDRLSFGLEPDNAGVIHGGSSYNRRMFSMFVSNPTEKASVRFYAMAGWNGFNPGDAANTDSASYVFYKAVTRPASAAEILAQRVIPLAATVSDYSSVLTDLKGKSEAYAEKIVQAGQGQAFIQFKAKDDNGVYTSDVSIGAASISMYNQTTGGFKLAMVLAGGNAVFTGNLNVGAQFRLGNGAGWPVALAQRDFQLTDGQNISYGTTFETVPDFSFKLNNLAPLNAGETYQIYMENPSTTGATLRAKISVPAPPVSITLTNDYYSATGPVRQMDKGGNPDSVDGSYTLYIHGTMSGYANFVRDDGTGEPYQ